MKALLVANWKMLPATFEQARFIFATIKKSASATKDVAIVLAPPIIYTRELAKRVHDGIEFAAQNAFVSGDGARTGEISFVQLQNSGVKYCIIGHAERRAMGETDEQIAEKIRSALSVGIMPIVCIGEMERNASGDFFEVIKRQIVAALGSCESSQMKKVIIAYEPVWAIGADEPMSALDMHTMVIFIRKIIFDMHGAVAHSVRVLYGGSVDTKNASGMMIDGVVDGLLVGRASVDAEEIKGIIKSLQSN